MEKVDYYKLHKLIQDGVINLNNACDKDGELCNQDVFNFIAKYRGYFVALIDYKQAIYGIEYVPTGHDNGPLGPDEERELLPGFDDLSAEEHLMEFIELFKNAAYDLKVGVELGSIYELYVGFYSEFYTPGS